MTTVISASRTAGAGSTGSTTRRSLDPGLVQRRVTVPAEGEPVPVTVPAMAITDRRDARVERTVAKVLDAVRRLLRTEGLASVTFGRVSRESGVSRTTLYRHWSSPSELISEAWARVAPSNRVPHTDDVTDDLVGLFVGVRDVVESSTMRRSLPALLVAAQRDEVISALHARFVEDRRAPIIERLEVAVAEGQISRDADPDLLVDLLSGPIFYRQLLRRAGSSRAMAPRQNGGGLSSSIVVTPWFLPRSGSVGDHPDPLCRLSIVSNVVNCLGTRRDGAHPSERSPSS